MSTLLQVTEISVQPSVTEVSITMVQPEQNTISVTATQPQLEFTAIGVQGLVGAQGVQGIKGDTGQPLSFDLLTEEQKIALRGDVGNTSTNYTNLFNSVILS